MLDLLVDFDALVTHSLGSAFTLSIWSFPIRRRSSLFVSFQNGINGAGATAPDLVPGAATIPRVPQAKTRSRMSTSRRRAGISGSARPRLMAGDLPTDDGPARKWIFQARDFRLWAAYFTEARMTPDLVMPSARAALHRYVDDAPRKGTSIIDPASY
jgi:hypothetical protein